MKRIFAIIAAISTLMILTSGGMAYWYSSIDAKNAELAAVETVADSLASSISIQTKTLQDAADGLAATPDVVAALASGDPQQIGLVANKLQQTIPHTLRLRLLPPNIGEPDQSAIPHMGFGDMELVKATLTGRPEPVVQGEGEHRHLAITSPVHSGQQLVGVLLLSLKPDVPQLVLQKIKFDSGLIELKQDQLSLASLGKSVSKDDDPETIKIPHTRWQINYWPDVGTSGGDIGLMLAIVTLPSLLTCLGFFVGYRKLEEFLREDQSSILKAAKDMMQGKSVGNYPVHLDEMMPVISSIAQFKRVIGQVIGQDVSPIDELVGKEPDFFDESFDIDFLEESSSVAMPGSESVSGSGPQTVSIPMPTLEIPTPTPPEPETSMEFIPELPAATPTIGRPDEFVSPQGLSEQNLDLPIPDSWEFDLQPKTVLAPSSKPDLSTPLPMPDNRPASTSESKADSVFRAYDIRGIVGQNLNPDIVANIGRAFASEVLQLGIKTVVVAQDGRQASPELCQALIAGLNQAGCDVLDIGLAPTPILYFVAHHTEGRSGIIVTGSSSPGDHNGLKMVIGDKIPGSELIQALRRRVENSDYRQGPSGSLVHNNSFRDEYIGMIADEANIVRPMTVVIDCSNGAASQLAPELLKAIGCDVVELNCELDGKFPVHLPDPSKPECFDSLIKAVKLNNADLGLLLDGDGDRLGLVDCNGRIIWPDRQMMLFVREILASKPGSQILYDSACSKYLPEQIAKRGGRGLMISSRHDVICTELKSNGAAFAGTMSGHFFFNDRWFGVNDGLYAAVRMIELLSADMRSSSEMFDDLPNSVNTPELRTGLPVGVAESLMPQLSAAAFSDASLVYNDGIRIEFSDGWALVRASSTDNSLILRFEADSTEALSRIQHQVRQSLQRICADISLPF